MGGEHSHCGHTDEQGEDQAIQGTLHSCKVGEEGAGAGGLQDEETAAPLSPSTEVTSVVRRGGHGSLATLRHVASLMQQWDCTQMNFTWSSRS